MSAQIELNFDDSEWFQEEVVRHLLKFIGEVNDILLSADMEVANLVNQGYDESLIDKMERDIKAIKFDEVNQALLSLV